MNDTDTKTTLISTKGRFTILFRQSMGLGYSQIEVSALTLEQGKWAQYDNAIMGTYTRKRARRTSMIPAQSYSPSLVVLEGWGHPELCKMWDEGTRSEFDGGSSVSARYSSCDPRWSTDLRANLARYVESTGAVVKFDFHGHDTQAR